MAKYSHDIFDWVPPHLLEQYLIQGGDFADEKPGGGYKVSDTSPLLEYLNTREGVNLTAKELKVAAADYFNIPVHKIESGWEDHLNSLTDEQFTEKLNRGDLGTYADEYWKNPNTELGAKFIRATVGQDPEGVLDWGDSELRKTEFGENQPWEKFKRPSPYDYMRWDEAATAIGSAEDTGNLAAYALDDKIFNQAFVEGVEQPNILDIVEKVHGEVASGPAYGQLSDKVINRMGDLGAEFAQDEYNQDIFTYDISDENEADTGGIMNFLKNLIR